MSEYRATIGIEVHTQLNTKSKMFCGCNNDSREAPPNTNICPICLGYPGSLPATNKAAVQSAIKLGLGLKASIANFTKFDRKNYFYPDLPKGYQISQFDLPIVYDGEIEIMVEGEFRKIGVERAHLEEDAAKLIHPEGANYSLVDYNRGGTPLVEIVSKPEMHTPAEARRYLQELYNLVTTLGICDGNMEEGNFKFDLNVSVSDTDELGAKVELKNLNSFRYAEKALAYEIERQIDLAKRGENIEQETRGYNETKGTTFSQRSKEAAHDYRYFPEPDLPPIEISEADIEAVRATMPKLPIEIRHDLHELGVSQADADILLSQQHTLKVFLEVEKLLVEQVLIKKALSWLIGDYQNYLKSEVRAKRFKERGIVAVEVVETIEAADNLSAKYTKLTATNLADLVRAVEDGSISSKTAKEIFPEVVNGASPAEIIERHGHAQISDEGELARIVEAVVAANPQAQEDYRAGKTNALGFLMGQVMAQTKGQANPSKAGELMRKYLEREHN